MKIVDSNKQLKKHISQLYRERILVYPILTSLDKHPIKTRISALIISDGTLDLFVNYNNIDASKIDEKVEFHNFKEVYIVGHDLYSDTDKVNNIYAGTDSYADKDALAAKPDNVDETFNWILQHKNTFDKFPNVQFYKVNKGAEAKTDMPIKEWSDCPNLKYITQEEMAQRLYN